MLRNRRLIAAGFAVLFVSALGGCSSFNVPSLDPTDMLDFLDTKKRAPGERKPVFPEGVPGVTQGVPKEMIRGSQESMAAQQQAAPPVEAVPEPPPAARAKSSTRRTAARPARSQVEIAPDDVNVETPPAR
ncbi:MAG: hypothetical protein EOP18_06880 [Rhizobiaceae bacterium]|jgi:hypothetical protein|nr:MAG: hypothetical protein EOP18_06880 [Rhizobiaceae bacterium]